MARLWEDNSSDEDLPDLATLLKSKPKSARTCDTTLKTSQPQREHSPAKTSSVAKGSAISKETSVKNGAPEGIAQKTIARRRVLTPTTPNPLLLPIAPHRLDDGPKRARTKVVEVKKSSGLVGRDVPTKKEVPNVRIKEYKTPELSSDDDDVFKDNTVLRRVPAKGQKKALTTSTEIRRRDTSPRKEVPEARNKEYYTPELSSDEDVFRDDTATRRVGKEPKKAKTVGRESSQIRGRGSSPKKELPKPRKKEDRTPEISRDDDVFQDDAPTRRAVKGPKGVFYRTGVSSKEYTQPRRNAVMAKEALSIPRQKQATYGKQEISSDEENQDKETRADDSSGMSDFVVEDDESLFEYSEDEECSLILSSPPPAPKSPRKLVRGRRPEQKVSLENIERHLMMMGLEDSDEDVKELDGLLSTVDLRKDGATNKSRDRATKKSRDGDIACPKVSGAIDFIPKRKVTTSSTTDPLRVDKQSSRYPPSSSFDCPSAILEYSPPRLKSPTKPKAPKLPQPQPPISLPKKLPKSPKKLFPSLPPSPHKPTMAEFWSQEETNEWVDKHSPKKLPPPKLPPPTSTLSESPAKNATELSAKETKTAFDKIKTSLALTFLRDLDHAVTCGHLSTLFLNDIQLVWSNTLNKTAGQAVYRTERLPSGQKHLHGRIELASKVVTDEYRLFNTIAHEYCHLANFAITKQLKEPHGKSFFEWAKRVEEYSAKLLSDSGVEDVVVKISAKHSYDIAMKYEWKCAGSCGAIFKRHSKSIDPRKQHCGKCKSVLVQTKPAPRARPKVLNGYQLFVKENMGRIKRENPGVKQKDVWALLSREYRVGKEGKGEVGGMGTMGGGGSYGEEYDAEFSGMEEHECSDPEFLGVGEEWPRFGQS